MRYLVTQGKPGSKYPQVIFDTDDLKFVQTRLSGMSPSEALSTKVWQERGFSYQPPTVVIDELVKTEKIDDR